MNNRLFLLGLLFPTLSLLVSCGSKQFTQGKYDDIAEERLLDDQFNESDMRRIADTMAESLTQSKLIGSVRRPLWSW